MSDPQHNPSPDESWLELMTKGGHWNQVDTAIAWQALAKLLEDLPHAHGNAALAWMHAAVNYRAYYAAWSSSHASRWDYDYFRETENAQARFEQLRTSSSFASLDPIWINTLLAGQIRQAAHDAMRELDSDASKTALAQAARKVIAMYCKVAKQPVIAKSINPSSNPPT